MLEKDLLLCPRACKRPIFTLPEALRLPFVQIKVYLLKINHTWSWKHRVYFNIGRSALQGPEQSCTERSVLRTCSKIYESTVKLEPVSTAVFSFHQRWEMWWAPGDSFLSSFCSLPYLLYEHSVVVISVLLQFILFLGEFLLGKWWITYTAMHSFYNVINILEWDFASRC